MDLETPACQLDVQFRQKNKSSDKTRSEKCTSAEVALGVTTPTKALFNETVSTEMEKSDAPVLTSEAIAGEVGQLQPIFGEQIPMHAVFYFPYHMSLICWGL